MKKILAIGLCATPLIFCQLAQAQESDHLGIGLKIGTTGASVELTGSLTDSINLRGSYNYAEFDMDIEDTDINYNSTFDKSSFALMLDWHIGGGGFRLTAGAYSHSENEIDIVAKPLNGSYEINGINYDATQIGSVNGTIGFEKLTPYVGIGWGNAAKAGNNFGLVVDLGIQMQDTPDISLMAVDCTLNAAVCNQLNSDIQAEITELDKDLSDFEFWPVASIGFSFHF